MKFVIKLLACAVLLSNPLLAWEEIPISNIFTPHGFDTSEDVYLIVDSRVPNSCYDEQVQVETEIDEKTKQIHINAYAKKAEGNFYCIEVVQPNLQEIALGNLNRGQWNIIMNHGTDFSAQTEIFINDQLLKSSGILNLVNISDVRYNYGDEHFTIEGYIESECDTLNGAPLFISNGINAVTVIPQISRAANSIPLNAPRLCPRKRSTFSKKVKIPRDLELIDETVLFHIKSAGSKSFNFVAELY